jgi:hypothetical protein
MSAQPLKDNRRTAAIAIAVAAMGVAVLSAFTAGTPGVITQLIFGVGGFAVSGLVTIIVMLIPPVRRLPLEQLRRSYC